MHQRQSRLDPSLTIELAYFLYTRFQHTCGFCLHVLMRCSVAKHAVNSTTSLQSDAGDSDGKEAACLLAATRAKDSRKHKRLYCRPSTRALVCPRGRVDDWRPSFRDALVRAMMQKLARASTSHAQRATPAHWSKCSWFHDIIDCSKGVGLPGPSHRRVVRQQHLSHTADPAAAICSGITWPAASVHRS